jgi:D-alanyl-D-alanine carboxypeptidase (penicillin-binding protein 5/6)
MFKKLQVNRKLKAFAIAIIAFSFIFITYGTSNCKIEASAETEGKAECVMELSSGKILHDKNGQEKLPMASTTKIMTALIIIENCDLDEEITVPNEAVGIEGSSIYLKKGEKISVKDLVYGLMLRSGNDCAHALAIHYSGNIESFVAKMNERAKELGIENTKFANPSGLPNENHYTTASDLCKLACAAMKNETFKKVVSTKNYNGEYRSFANKNKMLYRLDGANGIKTGYTIKAGRCLVSSAERNGMDVVCVVLNCPDMYERSANLINWCFDNYKLQKIDKNKLFMCGRVLCKLYDEYEILVNINDELNFKTVFENNSKKIKAGDLVGKLQIYCQNDLIFCQNLYSIINE